MPPPIPCAFVRVLVFNVGSSSVKVRLLEGDALMFSADLARNDALGPGGRLAQQLRTLPPPDVVGHRVVHGARRFRHSVVVNEAVLADLEALTPLAPLHNPPALHVLRLARESWSVPHVACFDTAFHRTMPAEAATFAIPEEWRLRWGLHRYGFHGLSHAYAARRAAELLVSRLEDLRIVVCHLGAGASLCAIKAGRSVDTTMGYTPLDGLVMATRSGSVDPGALLWLQREAGLSADDVGQALEERSGLLGLSGLSGSPSELYEVADGGHEEARLALDVYRHRLCAMVAAMATSSAGIDVLVFTGGAGEHCPRLRSDAAARLNWLGITVDPARNDAVTGDGIVSSTNGVVATCVVASREDIEIAREARRLVSGPI